jgi:pilus assembly protein Flp/PilA
MRDEIQTSVPLIARGRQTNRGERGATAVEYGLLLAFIAGVIITAVTVMGADLAVVYSNMAARLP